MTEAQTLEAIYQQFKGVWDVLHPSDCPLLLDGEPADAPPQWVRLTMVPDARPLKSIGAPGTRRVATSGLIAVEVFCDIGQTLKRAQLCDDVRTAIELKTIVVAGSSEPVRTYTAPSRNPSTDGRWMKQNVVTTFDAYSQV